MDAITPIEKFKSRLIRRRAELSARLRSLEEDLATFRPDDDDRAVEREDEEVLESLGEQGLLELRAIDAALQRIDDGRFGICAQCGQPISGGRLDAVPHAALCMACVADNNEGVRNG
jgi:RNA polymerase-binding protein DksA